MRKWLIAGVVVAVIVGVVLLARGGGEGSGYVVRAIFDSGSFMVKGEQVRVAGANVGTIKSVDVTMPGEVDSYENGRAQSIPGKAAIVMEINDPAFEDFRKDASCLIRPQSLIGEKFVDCRPTLPRAPGSKPAPPLEKIPNGQPGAGQYLLPVENNSTSVDPDLINNIQQLPYSQRFRLILNELGTGLAGRGKDLEEVVKRANPTLRDADRLFGILRNERNELAKLASDSEQILAPLSRERAHVVGFFANAGAAAEASSERGAALEASLRKFPTFLREFRHTMHSLQGFSAAAAPVFNDLGTAAPSFTRWTRALAPFFNASTVSLKALGEAGEVAGPILHEADPVVVKARDLARSGVSPTTKLAKFLVSTQKTGGFNGLVDMIYNSTASLNEFDKYGHFVRSLVALTNCQLYYLEPTSGCSANFNGPEANASSVFEAAATWERIQSELAAAGVSMDEEEAPEESVSGAVTAPSSGTGAAPSAPGGSAPSTETPEPAAPSVGEGKQLGSRGLPAPSQRALLDYLLGP